MKNRATVREMGGKIAEQYSVGIVVTSQRTRKKKAQKRGDPPAWLRIHKIGVFVRGYRRPSPLKSRTFGDNVIRQGGLCAVERASSLTLLLHVARRW